jgi:hypothetical protein
MFDSLDEQIRIDERKAVSNKERMMRWALILLLTVVIFSGLYLGFTMLQGT